MDEEPQILLKEGMMKKHMPPPFPQALRGKKPIKNASEILECAKTSEEDERLGFSSLGAKVINFVDYLLNQGAPAGHKSADTPSGHESNGAVAGDGATLQ
ncbi:hypothetical protein CK203_107931 [Vitis vinifera]|uniref:Uncharacterized protein n=1 Tax=Vitis vinifera TaxID=29760 RepID=A0A438DD06_VITVI|nr:hypothetical protein CK203_107931 [Vitis vinifera]